ncbi:MAG TPA: helix-turn-helix transcriptional regulator [Solirubrobacterales bacterium]|nr:helix-turn-helix transcriptional regulator [Solirubrobacterales bacterium]
MAAKRDRTRSRPERGRSAGRGEAPGGGVERKRGVFMISVAAELADMHPQTLRMYEARGLITPKRSPKKTRLYSVEDVERLRRIQRMTSEEGLNLAGVETVLELEEQLERARSEMSRLRARAAAIERQMAEEIERVRRSFRAELVPYRAYESTDLVPADAAKPIKIKVERKRGGQPAGG